MAMKELFRVTLATRQIREACVAYAAQRVMNSETMDVETEGLVDGAKIDVVFRKKREPKAKP